VAHLTEQHGKRLAQHRGPSDHDERRPRGRRVTRGPIRLAQSPPRTIALHRQPQLAAHREADTCGFVRFSPEHDERRTIDPLAPLKKRRERPPLRRSAVCGPSRDDASIPCVRPSSSCAHETRASWPGGVCWVETSASSSNAPFRSSNRHSVGTRSRAVNRRTPLRRCEPPCYRAGSVIGWS